ncbi:hypothetical protein OCAE111667_11310 [Occultella aeris]|uniref:Heme peroxidase n=1 Tax=Occultella aeris TaxID=2761496 RepID=A0A7M4DPL7_9MICO|nr:hypothetical protein [Occultella aeris]VZO39411.1 hypothetical protein HALOF300_04099 [Occultella aeris]
MTRSREDSEAELAQVVEGIKVDLGPEASWPSPVLLNGLALCVMNSIYSTGNRSERVVRVLDRYRRRRRDAGFDPALDGPKDLLAEIDECGGPEGFANALENHWRAWSSKTAPYKAEVIYQAAKLLDTASVNTREQLEEGLRDSVAHEHLKRGWQGLPGQGSGLTWRYFLMNAGMPGIKADRMIIGWTVRTLGRTTTPVEAERLLTDSASQLGVETRRLDHALWDYTRRTRRQQS